MLDIGCTAFFFFFFFNHHCKNEITLLYTNGHAQHANVSAGHFQTTSNDFLNSPNKRRKSE